MRSGGGGDYYGTFGSCLIPGCSLGTEELFDIPARATEGVRGHDDMGYSMVEDLATVLAAIFPGAVIRVIGAGAAPAIGALQESCHSKWGYVAAAKLSRLGRLPAHCYLDKLTGGREWGRDQRGDALAPVL